MNANDRRSGRIPPAPTDITVPMRKVEPIEVTPLDPVREKENYLPTKPSGWAALILATCAMVVAVVTSVWCLLPAAEKAETHPSSQIDMTVPISHEHIWADDYETVHHDATTHEETVAPVYEAVIEYHTVCNECNEQIDGIAREHIEETGHTGYSTNVPIAVPRLITEGRIDVIEDSPAYEESVVTGRHCIVCGETA